MPVSIVCVFNDPDVRARCLDRSVEAGRPQAPETEYLPVDNTAHQFASAGAALNHGIRSARNDVVVLVHQDVYLHSLAALETMAGVLLDDPGIGLAGAVGITHSGGVSGVVRDRVVMIGEPAGTGETVDSLDEVLLMITRVHALREPLSVDPDLAWHAYGVEYGARMQTLGLRVVAADLPLTHNSMTTNLARLTEAHAHVALLYPSVVPLQTTCGVVGAHGGTSRWRALLRRRRGAMAWLRESGTATQLARAGRFPLTDVVLADIRLEIDDALATLDAGRLTIRNLEPVPQPAAEWAADALPRGDREASAAVADVDDAVAAIRGREGDEAVLITGVDARTLERLAPALRDAPFLVGVLRDTGAWVLVHDEVAALDDMRNSRRTAPFALRGPKGDVVTTGSER
ncbi:MAG: glycosyltransferase [Candidatus Nanopelagicales bacterium]